MISRVKQERWEKAVVIANFIINLHFIKDSWLFTRFTEHFYLPDQEKSLISCKFKWQISEEPAVLYLHFNDIGEEYGYKQDREMDTLTAATEWSNKL